MPGIMSTRYSNDQRRLSSRRRMSGHNMGSKSAFSSTMNTNSSQNSVSSRRDEISEASRRPSMSNHLINQDESQETWGYFVDV
mmetsp:Transcript_14598/g.21522  ORF Transcript_14598/g.21522 Transcript_14598/m.21522 type:complete len:83 (-) Transcript_14598:98-346(-)